MSVAVRLLLLTALNMVMLPLQFSCVHFGSVLLLTAVTMVMLHLQLSCVRCSSVIAVDCSYHGNVAFAVQLWPLRFNCCC